METQEVLKALNHELFIVSGGKLRVCSKTSATLGKWFPGIEVLESDGKLMKMNNWGISLKYRPSGEKTAGETYVRTVVELDYRKKDLELYSKMTDSKYQGVMLNDLSPKLSYMFAHIELETPLDLSQPMSLQIETIKQIHENTLELINWWKSI